MSNQNADQRKRIIEILKSYPKKQKQIRLLRYELEHVVPISETELIESMSLGKPESGVRNPGHISNRTMKIAMQYQDATQRMNEDVVAGITQELNTLEDEVERIDYYIGLLEEGKAHVLRRYYFEQRSWGEIEAEMHLSQRALIKRRDEAIAELGEMFGLLDRIRGE